jgi:predicted flap endonuclease-1-like 5' DNA nuclease
MAKSESNTFEPQQDDSFLRRTVMGMLLGIAIGWVLLRYRRSTGGEKSSYLKLSTDQEIEIPPIPNIEPLEIKQEAPAESDTKDRLEVIKGIGPVYAKRLNQAGIFTYGDLANKTTDQLIKIVQAKPWQAVEIQEWIRQAEQLSD